MFFGNLVPGFDPLADRLPAPREFDMLDVGIRQELCELGQEGALGFEAGHVRLTGKDEEVTVAGRKAQREGEGEENEECKRSHPAFLEGIDLDVRVNFRASEWKNRRMPPLLCRPCARARSALF